MMNIYVASSWRNNYQPAVIRILKDAGYKPYDFRNPRPGDNGFRWSDIDPEWESWTTVEYRENLIHPIAERGFKNDFEAMQKADIGLLVLPCGRSAHTEAGWLKGVGKPVFVLFIFEAFEPELMYKIYDGIFTNKTELLAGLKKISKEFV